MYVYVEFKNTGVYCLGFRFVFVDLNLGFRFVFVYLNLGFFLLWIFSVILNLGGKWFDFKVFMVFCVSVLIIEAKLI